MGHQPCRKAEVGYQRILGNPLVVHPVLHAAGVADSTALEPAGKAILFAWPLTRPDSAGVAVAAEIHCQLHDRSHQAFHEYDQPSVNYGRHPLDTIFLLPKSMVLVHNLRFYGTKRSSRHQDGTKDKDMTQSPSLKP